MENAEIKLSGSEKQIAWATDIINGARECIARGIEHHTLGGGVNIVTGERRKQPDDALWIEGYEKLSESFEKLVAKTTEAKDIIENRDRYTDRSLSWYVNQYVLKMQRLKNR